MMVTDVGRAVDQIQFTLNRLTATGRKPPWRKVLPKEETIYEEDEVCDNIECNGRYKYHYMSYRNLYIRAKNSNQF